jgi:quercetin dioxygenase-like cupin family protein
MGRIGARRVFLEDDGRHKRPTAKSVWKEPRNMKGAAKGTHFDLETMIEFAQDGIVSKTLVKTGGREVSLFCMSAGQTISTHKSSFPAIIHVVQGQGEMTLGNKTYHAKPNSWFYMPAQLPHAIEATGNLVFLLTLFKHTEKQIKKS